MQDAKTSSNFEDRDLRSVFVPKREAVMGGWRDLFNCELHNLPACHILLE
jgi:hypothetical protein